MGTDLGGLFEGRCGDRSVTGNSVVCILLRLLHPLLLLLLLPPTRASSCVYVKDVHTMCQLCCVFMKDVGMAIQNYCVFVKDVHTLCQICCVFMKDVGMAIQNYCVFVKDVERRPERWANVLGLF